MTEPTRKFQLVRGDVEILKAIWEFRLVTIDHLVAITGRKRRNLNNRLVKLEERDYVYRKRPPFQKYVYTIDTAAVPILVEQGVDAKERIDLRVRRLRDLKELFLKHALMLTGVHLSLSLACKDSPITLHEWREGNALHDSVFVSKGNKQEKLPVRPDAFFTLDCPDAKGIARRYFFLEADRSTTTHERFQKKITAYGAYYQQKLQMKKYGPNARAFRVITITLTEERALNLCAAARGVLGDGGGSFFYFAPLEHFSITEPQRALDDIFISPRDFKQGKRYRLLPPLET